MHDKLIILLFIKAPLKGRIKSRLAAAIGNDAALELYQRFVLDAIDTVGALAIPLRICFYPPDAGTTIRTWLGNEQACVPQQGNDLGERMEQAFEQVFQEGYERAVLIGSDIPELSTSIIDEAFTSLNGHDAVVGPAADGGYYLIGFTAKTFLPTVFHDIVWSTSTVCDETLGKFKQSGQRVHLLPKLHDVDTKDDLGIFFTQHRNDPVKSSRTLTYLTEQEGKFFRP
jgi:rSAM/selenodomain-associated transferase 1